MVSLNVFKLVFALRHSDYSVRCGMISQIIDCALDSLGKGKKAGLELDLYYAMQTSIDAMAGKPVMVQALDDDKMPVFNADGSWVMVSMKDSEGNDRVYPTFAEWFASPNASNHIVKALLKVALPAMMVARP
jgi:hypothetical protein